ncbi:hypothetical protein GS502_11180 [Rhodococcus hoagii]|nr:hypothetical protein [Prescottella equi]
MSVWWTVDEVKGRRYDPFIIKRDGVTLTGADGRPLYFKSRGGAEARIGKLIQAGRRP